MGENESNVRFRLIFEDLHLLDESQHVQGLRRCWFLLKPEITSIGDLVSQICNCFGIRQSIALYMDDFVLPSFESTCIITNKDIIRVRRTENNQNDICIPSDGQNLLQGSENAVVQDLDFIENLLVEAKSQENSQENRSCYKEILTSCMYNSVGRDSLGDVGSTKRNKRRSKKLLDTMGECDESSRDEAKSEPNNNCDVRKKKQARTQMALYISDEEEDFVDSVVRPGSLPFQPREYGKQPADETKEPVLFIEGSSIKELNRIKGNTFQQTNKKDKCFSGNGEPVSDGILPLPKSDGILPLPKSDEILSLPKSKGMSSAANLTKPPKHVINFETLIPLRRLPVKGDILAYRYIKLSSSMSQQLSSPQVGEVSSFDNKTLQVILLSAPDYAILVDENLHGTVAQPNASPCNENGSLEIEYLSLVDVRLVKGHTPKEKEKACEVDQDIKDNWEEALLKGNLNEPNAFTEEQDKSWAPWITNKSAAVMSWSCNLPSSQPIPPYAGGRGNGRGRRGGRNRGMNNRNRGGVASNWNGGRNNGAWNPNRNNGRAFAPPDDNPAGPPWSYEPSGRTNTWDYHRDNNMFLPPAEFPGQ